MSGRLPQEATAGCTWPEIRNPRKRTVEQQQDEFRDSLPSFIAHVRAANAPPLPLGGRAPGMDVYTVNPSGPAFHALTHRRLFLIITKHILSVNVILGRRI
jgi:hypothetical protein